MTTIDISKDYIHVFGHSGYAPEGFDIVCAAISTLTESLYRYLLVTKNKVECAEAEADYIIFLNNINDNGKGLITEYSNMVDELIKEYPSYIERKNYEKIGTFRKIRKNS